ncbi:FAD-dependent oxidoreductase [Frankia sp. AgPm24]|uniref:FAD-dependent oxidoreductase n=1 Tax=Frankia sp. AgPm24 TaxID=631128 RepID=UPI00200E910B|nr:FAD-dependent oxidoreductase [Frankia sp. AgPm24]MCK9920684.1 FAD-dependent oxidoreductase [Frankia sp. AgPm24]
MRWDVAVVGGGPVGMFLAAELRRADVSVAVFERRQAGASAAPDGGDRGLQARTLQLLRMRGLLDPVRAQAAATGGAGIAGFVGSPGSAAPADLAELVDSWGTSRFKGHFAMLALVDRDGELSTVPHQLAVWQDRLVEVLAQRARERGARLHHDSEVVGVTDRGNHVSLELTDGTEHQARWVVGCDGGHGVVRRKFSFDSTAPAMVVLIADVSLEPTGAVPPGVHRTPGGLMFVNPPPGDIVLVEFDGPTLDARGPVSREEFVAALRRISGTDVTVTAFRGAVRVTDHARVARQYRRGRLLLAGDAAHLHSPMGGQGLNLGLQDAASLGWRLARIATGAEQTASHQAGSHRPTSGQQTFDQGESGQVAPDGWLPGDQLLADYERERQAAARLVLRNTLAQSALLRTDAHSSALREIVAELIELPDAKLHLASMVAGLSTRITAAPGSHPLVGTFAPPAALDALSAQAGSADAVEPVTVWVDGLPGLVVRPDGYVESVA